MPPTKSFPCSQEISSLLPLTASEGGSEEEEAVDSMDGGTLEPKVEEREAKDCVFHRREIDRENNEKAFFPVSRVKGKRAGA